MKRMKVARNQRSISVTSDQSKQVYRNHTVHMYSQSLVLFDVFTMLIKFIFIIIKSMFRVIFKKALKDISKDIILITGTGHGIGRQLAIEYASHGCKVICVDKNGKTNDETVQMANESGIGKAYGFQCDVGNRSAIKELSVKILQQIGHVTVIVNNAGIMPSHPLSKHTDDEIRDVFNVNVLSHFWILESFKIHMEKEHRGHIIAISSVAGFCGLSNLIPYCSSKFAVRGLMEALHEEIRDGPFKSFIKTTLVYPYMVDTGLCKKPRMRFPKLLGFITPKMAALSIIDAHRRDIKEISVPKPLLYVNNIFRCLPSKCGEMFKDFMDSGVESDLQ